MLSTHHLHFIVRATEADPQRSHRICYNSSASLFITVLAISAISRLYCVRNSEVDDFHNRANLMPLFFSILLTFILPDFTSLPFCKTCKKQLNLLNFHGSVERRTRHINTGRWYLIMFILVHMTIAGDAKFCRLNNNTLFMKI